jgi:copper chaperone CopZ
MTADQPAPDGGSVTQIEVAGADCTWCMNATLDQLRLVDGVIDVHSSSAKGCIEVVHDGADVTSLLAVIRASLHGTVESSNELEMVEIDPHVRHDGCPHGSPPGIQPPHTVVRGRRAMETLTDAAVRLRALGYVSDYEATPDGHLECSQCRSRARPEDVEIHTTVRFEGDSNPDDEAILVAIACGCGELGQYSAAFGPAASALDADILRRLPFSTRR